jgi:hypothetical protein
VTQPVPPAGRTDRLDVWATPEPAHTSRHTRINRWLTTVALTVGIILMVIALLGTVATLTVIGGIRDRINQTDTAPTPAPTDCLWTEPGCVIE